MSFVVSSIVEVSVNKIALCINVHSDEWAAEWTIIASNVSSVKDIFPGVFYACFNVTLKQFMH